MNPGITISFAIGGVLLISLLTLNTNVMRNSHQLTSDLIEKQRVDVLRQIISDDMKYVGFGSGSDLMNFGDNHIEFQARINGSLRIISWQMPGNSYPGSPNPNHKLLRRVGPMDGSTGSVMSTYPVTHFEVVAYSDEEGTLPTTQKSEVRSILIEIVVESAEPTGSYPDGSPRYTESRWKKLFRPDNIMF